MKLVFIIFLFLFVPIYADNCDCSGRGVCLLNKKCLCDDGFITWPTDSTYQCNYEQTKKLGPFLCQLFIGLCSGCGALMLGQYDYGIAELVLFVLFIVLLCVLGSTYAYVDNNDVNNKTTWCLAVMSCCVYTIALIISALWLAVLVFISEGGFSDKNGAPLGDF